MKLIYLKSALKGDTFDVTIGIKIPFLEFWLLLGRAAPYYTIGISMVENLVQGNYSPPP